MLRVLIASLCLAQLVEDVDYEYGTGPTEVHRSALPRNGLGAWNDYGTTVPAPIVSWLFSSPLVNSANAAQTFTLTGSVPSINTPLCSDGGWDDLTNGCMPAGQFDGTADYYTADQDFGDPGSGDLTVCAFGVDVSVASAAFSALVSKRTSLAGLDGWVLRVDSAGRCDFAVDGTATPNIATGPSNEGVLKTCCGLYDNAGNTLRSCANGACSATTPADIGAIDVAQGMQIGAERGATNLYTGLLTGAMVWNSLLTTAQIAAFEQWYQGTHDEKAAAPTFTNTGPTYCWIAGALWGFDDDVARRGCEIPPGETGAGSPATSGYHAHPSVTNSLLQSEDLSVTWTAVGTAVVAASTVTMFGDGRVVQKATDDDGGAVEYVYQQPAKSGATSVIACVYAMTESGTGTVRLRVGERVGGTCTNPTNAAVTFSTSTTIAGRCDTRTFTDANCTNLFVEITPNDGVAASTGHAAIIAEAFYGIAYAPSIYVRTTTAAVTAGADIQYYDATGIVQAGQINGQYTLSVEYTPFLADAIPIEDIFGHNNGASTQRVLIRRLGDETLAVYVDPAAAYILTSAVLTWTPGTLYRIEARLNFDSDKYQLLRDGVSLATSTTAYTAPSGQTRVQVGSRDGGVQQVIGIVNNARVVFP